MPALHALSNRVTADLSGLIDLIDSNDLRNKPGYLCSRNLFTASIAGFGWEGFAMRCWTDPKGYAGYMQYIENEGLYSMTNDLSRYPHAGGKLKEALDLYGHILPYPWIGAACIRWAVFGKNTTVDDVPENVRWLKQLYAPRQVLDHWGSREVFGEPLDFGEFAPVVDILLQSPDVWLHMWLQEGPVNQSGQTMRLWLHWAESIGHECSKERELFDNRKNLMCLNSILQGDNADLEMMLLGDAREYAFQKALSKHKKTTQTLELPAGIDTFSP